MRSKHKKRKINDGNPFVTISGLLIIGSLIFMLINDDWKHLFTSKTNISVYLSSAMCEKSIGQTEIFLCKKHEAKTASDAEQINWPYRSKNECEEDYGTCIQSKGSQWHPLRLGFALAQINDQYQSIPIYYSIKLSQYLTPSGFPLSVGQNWIENFPKDYVEMLKIPSKFNQVLCFKLSTGNEICKSKNELLAMQTEENLNMLLYSFVGVVKF